MRLWIDTDIGDDPDDTVALWCAARSSDAQLVGVSTATIYRLCTRGDLQHFRISNAIRVCADDLAAFLKAERNP